MDALEKMVRAWWEIRETTMPERIRVRWEDGSPLARETLVAQCIHALEAIREPSLGLVQAMNAAAAEHVCLEPPEATDARMWRAAIDYIVREATPHAASAPTQSQKEG